MPLATPLWEAVKISAIREPLTGLKYRYKIGVQNKLPPHNKTKYFRIRLNDKSNLRELTDLRQTFIEL